MSENKKHFMLWSTPPRTTFSQDMTEEERNIMHQHIAYWTDKQNQGIALVFGPVLNPQAPHGLAIIEVENAEPSLTTRRRRPRRYCGIDDYRVLSNDGCVTNPQIVMHLKHTPVDACK